jgi:pyridoxine 4-dehydrogenase
VGGVFDLSCQELDALCEWRDRPRQIGVDDPEGVPDLCTQKNIAYVPFFPLAVGNVAKDKPVLAAIAEKHRASSEQIALAWLLARSPVMLPIPGTSSVEHLQQNWDARRIALSHDEIAAIAKHG